MKIVYNIIYHPFFNVIVRNLNRLVYIFFPKILKLNPSGKLRIKLNKDVIIINTNQTSYLTYLLYWYGIEQFEYSPIFLKLIKKVNTFYDIGSNIGYYSLLGAKVNPNLSVEAFEPSPGVLMYLQKNIKDNLFESRIICNSIALAESKGKLSFNEIYNPKYPNTPNLSGEHNLGTKFLSSNKISVDSETLDNFYQEWNGSNVDLIKIDTEGTENIILENASHLIENCKPIIICETLFNQIEHKLEEIMLSHGYEFFNHKGNYLVKVTTIKREKDDGIRNCFFVHPSKTYLIEEFLSDKINS